jgi:hypothetical protein
MCSDVVTNEKEYLQYPSRTQVTGPATHQAYIFSYSFVTPPKIRSKWFMTGLMKNIFIFAATHEGQESSR